MDKYKDFGFERFLSEVTNVVRKTDWRYGQALFNLLAIVRPALSERVRGSNIDPFYKNREEVESSNLHSILRLSWDE
jgi:hypothetical protein